LPGKEEASIISDRYLIIKYLAISQFLMAIEYLIGDPGSVAREGVKRTTSPGDDPGSLHMELIVTHWDPGMASAKESCPGRK